MLLDPVLSDLASPPHSTARHDLSVQITIITPYITTISTAPHDYEKLIATRVCYRYAANQKKIITTRVCYRYAANQKYVNAKNCNFHFVLENKI